MKGLVGWWPLHSDTPVDLSGQGNHGTNNGATTGVVGKGGLTAYSFDGTDDYIPVGTGLNSIFNGGGSITVSVWVNANTFKTSGRQGISLEEYDPSSNNVCFMISHSGGGEWETGFYDGSWHITSNPVSQSTNEWIHLSATYDGNTIKLYENGSQTSSLSDSSGLPAGDEQWSIGRRWDKLSNSDSYWDGQIFDTRIYNRALTQTEIQTLYEWGSGDYVTPKTDGVSYYPLDGDANDQWGTNDGTVNGATVTDDAIRGQAYSFNGEGDNIDVGISNALKLGNTNWTITAWINPQYNQNGSIVTQTIWETGTWRVRYDPSGSVVRLHWNGWGADPLDWNTTLSENTWHFLVYKMENTGSGYRGTIYHNAEEKSSAIGSSPSTTSDSSVAIGSNLNGQDFEGEIDDVRIYDYALSPNEIHDLYRWGTFGRDMRAMTVRA